MMLFVSPTKNMKPRTIDLPMTLPQFCVEAEALLDILKTYNDEDIMNIMKVNAKLAVENQKRFQHIRFDLNGTHAITTYDGLAFQHMRLDAWTLADYTYAQDHMRILSGFYGVLKPLDSIYPYRLEMQARGLSQCIDNLYSYWSDALMSSMRQDQSDTVYINLASKEYSQAVLPYLKEQETCINVDFKVVKDGTLRVLATAAKMARGAMVNYIIQHRIEDPQALKDFSEDGWAYMETLSKESEFVFVKQ